VRCLNLEGGIHFELGNLELAHQIFHTAVGLADTLPDESVTLAKLWNNLGMIAHLRADDQLAIEHYADALQIYTAEGDDRGIAQTAHNLALRLAAAGILDGALEHANDAVRHAALVADPALNALVRMGRAEVHLECNEWAAAQGDIFAALAAAMDARDHLGVAEGLRLRAEVALRRGEYDFARKQAEAAYRKAVEVGATITAAECGAVLSIALKRLDREEDAVARYEETAAQFRNAGAIQPLERFLAKWNAA
jgi:tetratricopeptide (TPR) repeat protein